jgi:hypothetical protein
MAPCECSITTSSTYLLNVVFDTSRKVVMDYTLDISLVDTHGECNSAAKYFYLVAAELLLNVASLILAFASVVGSG